MTFIFGVIVGILLSILTLYIWYWHGTNQLMTGIFQDDDVMKNYEEILDEQERKVGSSEKTEDS